MFKKTYLLCIAILALNVFNSTFAQDTLRVMQYNLFRYGESGKEPSVKNPLLSTIVNYVKPDIIGVNELSATADYASTVLSGALNINGVTTWRRGTLSKAGADKSLTNTVFYNSEKFILLKQDTVSTIQREITAFNFMYNDSNLVKTKDTVFFTVIVLHFKAGNTSTDETTRGFEAAAIASYLNAFPKAKNVVVMGDFNVYMNTEPGFANLVGTTNDLNKLMDPINRMGTWNNNAAYADIHTQSTHTTQTGGFSSGGMDDRFDIMLCTKSLMHDSLKVRILPSTYKAVGNDGLHFNLALNASPTNTSVPADVLNALYNMSDHIPVRADFVFNPTKPVIQGINFANNKFSEQVQIQNPFSNELNIHVNAELLNKKVRFDLYDLNAKCIISLTKKIETNDFNIEFPYELPQGIYILKMQNEQSGVIQRKLLKK